LFNRPIADEREVVGALLGCLYVGDGRVVRSSVLSGLPPDRCATQAPVYAGRRFDRNVNSGGYRLFTRRGGSWTEQGGVGA
jgi:hypothetical protein